ncbi:HNH endonuclease [Aneurinibacillus terranovensis]|uniref:HNH endonuclease n=1 Tax=Aneurinibacillus terranovensis TaxID=278991 RepID=UPI0006851E77|nr:HNH endonuclease [Aneurinibacillus terranovensis]
MGDSERYKCIWCEKSSTELDYLKFVKFIGTGWGICQLCYWKLEDEGYMDTNPNQKTKLQASFYTKATIPPDIRSAVLERDNYTCRYCDSKIDLTLDHIYPESRGGEATMDNLVVACRSCNSKKGSKTPEEAGMKFLNRDGRLRRENDTS